MKIEITVNKNVAQTLLDYFNIRYKKNFKMNKLHLLCKLAVGEVFKDQSEKELAKIDKKIKEL